MSAGNDMSLIHLCFRIMLSILTHRFLACQPVERERSCHPERWFLPKCCSPELTPERDRELRKDKRLGPVSISGAGSRIYRTVSLRPVRRPFRGGHPLRCSDERLPTQSIVNRFRRPLHALCRLRPVRSTRLFPNAFS